MESKLDDFKEYLDERNVDLEGNAELIAKVLEAACQFNITDTLSDHYVMDAEIGKELQTTMLDEALSNVEQSWDSIAKEIKERYLEKDSKPTEEKKAHW